MEDEDGKRVDERAALLGAGKKARADRAENRSTAGSLSLSTASTDWNDVDPENAYARRGGGGRGRFESLREVNGDDFERVD